MCRDTTSVKPLIFAAEIIVQLKSNDKSSVLTHVFTKKHTPEEPGNSTVHNETIQGKRKHKRTEPKPVLLTFCPSLKSVSDSATNM
uniref:Uncharacterized protein n=1 Tax=Anguilla anguilla TaxID=7936 RepID=A0A0E9W9L7_ANGAN